MVENGKETIVNIDDEIPFDIPESWAWCRLGNVCNYINAGGDKPNNFSKKITRENNIPIYSNGLDNEGLYGYTNSPSIIDPAITISARGTIGVPFIRTTPFVHIIRLIAVVPLSHIDISYLYYVLSTRRLVSEGSSIPQLTVPSVLPYLFPLPPIEEQKRIVEAIENLTNKISSIDEEYSSIEEKISLAKSKLLDLAIRGKLLPQDENDEPASKLLERIRKEKESAQLTSKSKRKTAVSYIFKGEDNLYYEKIGNSVYLIDDELPCKLPDNWQWAQFSDICDLYTGNSISKEIKAKKYTNLNNGYNYIGTKDVGFDNQINYNNGVKIPFAEMGFKIAPKNAVLLCIEGGSAGRKIGVTREDVCFGNKLCCFYSKTICNEFIYIYLQSPLFKKLFKESLMGLIGGVGTGSLEKIYVPIPPINEQKRISNFLDKAFEQLDALIQH